MKRIIKLNLTWILVLGMLLSLSALSLAYKPVDGDFNDIWGILDEDMGDSLEEVADGVNITFGRPNWPARVSSLDTYKLDGLTISFKDVSISDKNGMAIGFTNTEGGWVDGKGLFFLHFNAATHDTLGEAPNGYVLAKQGDDMNDVKGRVFDDELHAKKPAGNIVVSIKKASNGDWTYSFNGQNFTIAKEMVDNHIKDQDDVYISLGSWGTNRGVISYTVADISVGGAPAPTSPPSEPTKPAGPTSPATQSKDDTKSSGGQTSQGSGGPAGAGSEDVNSEDSEPADSEDLTSDADGSSEDLTSQEGPEDQNGESQEPGESAPGSSEGDDDGDKEEGKSNLVTIIAIVVIALALVGAVVSGLMMVKKKKDAGK